MLAGGIQIKEDKIIHCREFQVTKKEKIWKEFYDVSKLNDWERIEFLKKGYTLRPIGKKCVIPISEVREER